MAAVVHNYDPGKAKHKDKRLKICTQHIEKSPSENRTNEIVMINDEASNLLQ